MSKIEQEQYPVIQLIKKLDKMPIETMCPIDGKRYQTHVAYVYISCTKCGTNYRTELKQDMYYKVAKKIDQRLRWNNGVIIQAEEDYYHCLTHIKDNHEGMGCWDVSKITPITETIYYCSKCGVCKECLTCKDCGASFKKDKTKRKIVCTKCGSNKCAPTYFSKVKTMPSNPEQKMCPECGSDSIQMSISKTKLKCHICGSKIKDKREIEMQQITIERKKAYRKENI